MKLEITFKNKHESHEEIIEFCLQRLEKLERFFPYPLHAKMTLSVERAKQIAELNVMGNHVHFSSKGGSKELHLAIEKAIERMHKQISKKKEKMSSRRRKRTSVQWAS